MNEVPLHMSRPMCEIRVQFPLEGRATGYGGIGSSLTVPKVLKIRLLPWYPSKVRDKNVRLLKFKIKMAMVYSLP